eukprot:scaffold1618_cov397-Prasinococcus_capsulatus_cf.AAC.13
MVTFRSVAAVAATVAATITRSAYSLECVEDYDPAVDYFPSGMRASASFLGDIAPQLEEETVFADDFSITYYKAYKVRGHHSLRRAR